LWLFPDLDAASASKAPLLIQFPFCFSSLLDDDTISLAFTLPFSPKILEISLSQVLMFCCGLSTPRRHRGAISPTQAHATIAPSSPSAQPNRISSVPPLTAHMEAIATTRELDGSMNLLCLKCRNSGHKASNCPTPHWPRDVFGWFLSEERRMFRREMDRQGQIKSYASDAQNSTSFNSSRKTCPGRRRQISTYLQQGARINSKALERQGRSNFGTIALSAYVYLP
jgi:hypothetical protein